MQPLLLQMISLMCHPVQIAPRLLDDAARLVIPPLLAFVPRQCTETFASHTCHLQMHCVMGLTLPLLKCTPQL